MPDDRTESVQPPSWRRKATSPTPRAERPAHEWTKRKAKPTPERKRPRSGIGRIIAAVVGLLASLAAVVALIILIWPPSSVAVVLVGADYADNPLIPPNILGWKGIEALQTLAGTPPPQALFPPARLEMLKKPLVLNLPDDWDRLIDDLKKSRFQQKTILIVLALHGGSDSQGAYFCPGRMARPEEQLTLSRVIKSVAELPPDKQKILVLEATQVPANWQLGMMHNDFARWLDAMETEIRQVPNLWVLSSTGVDQRCWGSEGLGQTVFNHYLIEALRGRAVRDDGRMSLRDVHNYVSKHVQTWTWNARGAIQEPVLLPRSQPPEQKARQSGSGASPHDQQARTLNVSRPSPGDVLLASAPNASALAIAEHSDQALSGVWKDFQDLDSLVPHPAVYSPRRWRQYRAELVRFDEIVRAGASEQTSSSLRDRLTAQKGAMERERLLKPLSTSLENNLAMSALAGPGGQPETSGSEFLSFWKAQRGSESAKAWEALRQSDPDPGQGKPTLRAQCDEFLLTMAARDPGRNLEMVADKLQITRGNDAPQPAEAHLARMLARHWKPVDGQPQQLLEQIGRAILLRKQAERAALGASSRPGDYSYSEQCFPWISKWIETADTERRAGEDRLFASDESAWNQAAAAMGKAGSTYAEIVSRTATIRQALVSRDQALADLPCYSHWVADRFPDKSQGELISEIEGLWERTHRLTEQLEKPSDAIDLVNLHQASGELSEGMNRLSQRFAELAERIDTSRLKEDWEASSASLAVAVGDAGGRSSRQALWDRMMNIEKHDREVAEVDQPGDLTLSDQQRASETRRTRVRAETQARMALATLGQRWFDDRSVFKASARDDFSSTARRLQNASELGSDKLESWSREIALIGDRIGLRWQRIVEEIARLSNEEDGITDFQAFQDRLVQADRLERMLGGGAARLSDSATQVAIRLREARVHTLLLGMADRAWNDHWYDEDPKDRYYQTAGSRFIDDADKLFPQSGPIHAARARMDRQGAIALSGKLPSLTLTSETNGSIAFRLNDQGIVPAGLPVVRAIAGQPLELEAEARRFRVVPRGREPENINTSFRNPLGDRFESDPQWNHPQVISSSFQLEGFFRGQRFLGTTSVAIHPVPDTLAIGPPPSDPPDASIAVRASKEIITRFGAGTGTIAIVLDCSGSMMDPSGRGRGTKFDDARTALGQVLKAVPPKTTLSLWTFSQLPENVPLLPNGKVAGRLLPPGLDQEPERTIKTFLPPGPWDPAGADALAKRIGQLVPFFETPLVEAMWMAANKDLKPARGLKTLLVLTDGDDNQLEKFNPRYNPDKLSVKDFLVNGFKPLGITVNMVFFTPAGDQQEIKRAGQRFGPALAQLQPPGSFRTAKDLDELIEILQRGLVQKLSCQILRPDGTPLRDAAIDVTDPQEEEQWSRGLEPGSYKLRVNVGSNLDQDIDLRKGDRIIVELVEDQAGAVACRRGLYTDSHEFRQRPRMENQNSRLTALTNQVRRDNSQDRLQLVAALERKPQSISGTEIRQLRAPRAWFRLGARDLDHPETRFMTRWRERVFYPGQVWQFDVPRWISGPTGESLASPVLKAWWSDVENPTKHAAELVFDSPGKPGEMPRIVSIGAGKQLTIESISQEEHLVEVAPGEPAQHKGCLVVRLSYAGQSPCLVDPSSLRGLKVVGHEHRLYSQANRYTGLFWPVNPEEFQRCAGLALISLGDYRAEAEKQNVLEIKLEQPREESQIPPPPTVLPRANQADQ